MSPRHINYVISNHPEYPLVWQDVPPSVAENYCDLQIFKIDLSLGKSKQFTLSRNLLVNEQCLEIEKGSMCFPNFEYFDFIKMLDGVLRDQNYLITTLPTIRVPTRWLWDFNSGIREELVNQYSVKVLYTIPISKEALKLTEYKMQTLSKKYCFELVVSHFPREEDTSLYIIVPKGEPLDAILYLKMSTDCITELSNSEKQNLFGLFS